jgi:exo-beta-1,3-glucanase (GH17 family)
MTREQIVETLKNYKRVVAIYESLQNEYEGVIQAQVISDMPKAHGVHSQVESAYTKLEYELKELQKEIKRVQIWLNYLTEEERFIVEQIYIEERYYAIAGNKWCGMGREYHSESYWKRKKKDGIRKIYGIVSKLTCI